MHTLDSARLLPGTRTLALALCTLAAAAVSGPAGAQGAPVCLVSTTSDLGGSGTHPPMTDGDVARLEAGQTPRVQLAPGHWAALAGFAPGDVDALALRPGVTPGSALSIVFSLLSNEQGFLDGDVIGLAPGGGFEVILPEAVLAAELGQPDANIDLDALTWDDTGQLLFSLQSDLAGTVLGQVLNGDVLRLDSFGGVSRVASEADVQAALLAATGDVEPVGDVHGITWENGELWVVTQSPGSIDGGAFSVGPTAAVKLTEADASLGGAELDALEVLSGGTDAGRLVVAPQLVTPGQQVLAEVDGGGAFHPLLLLFSGGAGYLAAPGLGGFGAWYLDPADPWLNAGLAAMAWIVIPLDGTGSADVSFSMPQVDVGGAGWLGGTGWTIQMLDLVTLELLAPFRVEY